MADILRELSEIDDAIECIEVDIRCEEVCECVRDQCLTALRFYRSHLAGQLAPTGAELALVA